MTQILESKIKKDKFKKALVFLLKAILFVIITIFTVYFFVHSPAWVNKINHRLNQDETAQILQAGLDDKNIITNTIIIPQANIYVPLVIENIEDEQDIKKAMQDGLVITPKDNGSLILGHYSDYFWNQGDYKYLLSSLGNLKTGDQIGINNNDEFIKYQVSDIRIVKAKDYSELNKFDSDLIIASHWPPSLKRYKLILEAKRIE